MTFSPAHWSTDDDWREDRDRRHAGPGHHDAVGDGHAELAAGASRLGGREVDRHHAEQRADDPDAAAWRSTTWRERTIRTRRPPSRPGATTAPRSSIRRPRALSPGTTNGCGTQDGRLYKGATDLYEIPYANKAGGAAVRRSAARRRPDHEEYYASFSPDDRLIAFTAVPAGQEMYANPSAELYVVAHGEHRRGDQAAANAPVACSGKVEPRRQQPLAEVVAGRDRRRRQDLLLAHLLVEPLRAAPGDDQLRRQSTTVVEVSQLYITAVVDRRDQHHHLPRDLPVEPAPDPAQHDAGLGALPHPDRHQLTAVALAAPSSSGAAPHVVDSSPSRGAACMARVGGRRRDGVSDQT